MAICLQGGGTINTNTTAGEFICSTGSGTDPKWPDISKSGWSWGTVTVAGNDSSVTATCPFATCGGTQDQLATVKMNGATFGTTAGNTPFAATFTPNIQALYSTSNGGSITASFNKTPDSVTWSMNIDGETAQTITTGGVTSSNEITCRLISNGVNCSMSHDNTGTGTIHIYAISGSEVFDFLWDINP